MATKQILVLPVMLLITGFMAGCSAESPRFRTGEEFQDVYGPRDDGTGSPVVSRFRVLAADSHSITFSVSTWGSGRSSCTIEDRKAFLKGTHFEFEETGGVSDCLLRIRRKDDLLVLEDVEEGCRRGFCGANASLDGVPFRKVAPK
jgi:hypothetical protein